MRHAHNRQTQRLKAGWWPCGAGGGAEGASRLQVCSCRGAEPRAAPPREQPEAPAARCGTVTAQSRAQEESLGRRGAPVGLHGLTARFRDEISALWLRTSSKSNVAARTSWRRGRRGSVIPAPPPARRTCRSHGCATSHTRVTPSKAGTFPGPRERGQPVLWLTQRPSLSLLPPEPPVNSDAAAVPQSRPRATSATDF